MDHPTQCAQSSPAASNLNGRPEGRPHIPQTSRRSGGGERVELGRDALEEIEVRRIAGIDRRLELAGEPAQLRGRFGAVGCEPFANRPDGYVGFRADDPDVGALTAYPTRFTLAPDDTVDSTCYRPCRGAGPTPSKRRGKP